MRTTVRTAVVSVLLGGGLLLAGPAVAQDADEYPADQPIGGAVGQPASGGVGGTTAGGGTIVSGSSGGAASLPFTGGEVALIALAGTAALGGGLVLTATARKRSTT